MKTFINTSVNQERRKDRSLTLLFIILSLLIMTGCSERSDNFIQGGTFQENPDDQEVLYGQEPNGKN